MSVSVGCKREVWPLLLLLALLTGCSNRDEREPAPPNEVPPQVAEAPGQQTERTETEHTEGREDPPTESTGDHGDDEDDVESWCWEGRRFRFERSEHEPPSERTEVRIDGLRWSIAESREGHGPTVFERYEETEGQTWVRVRWLPSGESPLPGEVRLLRVGDAPSESYEMSPENSYALVHSEAPTACLLQAYAYQPDDTSYECEELPLVAAGGRTRPQGALHYVWRCPELEAPCLVHGSERAMTRYRARVPSPFSVGRVRLRDVDRELFDPDDPEREGLLWEGTVQTNDGPVEWFCGGDADVTYLRPPNGRLQAVGLRYEGPMPDAVIHTQLNGGHGLLPIAHRGRIGYALVVVGNEEALFIPRIGGRPRDVPFVFDWEENWMPQVYGLPTAWRYEGGRIIQEATSSDENRPEPSMPSVE
ncbi:MAG: hypothetical protein AAF645_00470 [Myxococcota bacterium]